MEMNKKVKIVMEAKKKMKMSQSKKMPKEKKNC